MARRKSLFRRIVVLGILGLACFGGYVLYQDNRDAVNDGAATVEKKAKAVKKALEK